MKPQKPQVTFNLQPGIHLVDVFRDGKYRVWRHTAAGTFLLALVAIGAVSGATTSQRQVGGFVAQLPPQTPAAARVQPETPGHRYIPRPSPSGSAPNSVPIASLLRPEDKVVTVVSDDHLFYGTGSDPEKEFAGYTDLYPSVALIRVNAAEGILTANRDWVMSILTADVQSVLKDTTGRLVLGGLIEIVSSGGELMLDGRRIIAIHSDIEPLKVGGVYLAFLAVLDSHSRQFEGKFHINNFASVEIENDTIKRLRTDAHPESNLEQRSPEWLMQHVRAHARRKR
jgi:hypothetical protein